MVTIGVLDTSVLIDLARNHPSAKKWFEGLARHDRVVITPVVWMEAVQGAVNKIRRAQIMRFLRDFHIEHPTADDNRWAMLQLAQFHLSHGVEFPDVIIASVAVRLDVPLHTLNLKHYHPLVGLDAQRPY